MSEIVQEKALKKLSSWKLKHPEQDIRGWPVQDRAGLEIGTVRTLLANTDTEQVEYVVLGNGHTIPAEEIEIGDSVVLAANGDAAMVNEHANDDDRYVQVYRDVTETPPLYSQFKGDFERHCADTYGSQESFDRYEHAYRFGFVNGADPVFADRSFDHLDPEMRTGYESEYGAGSYNEARPAVLKGFECARSTAPVSG